MIMCFFNFNFLYQARDSCVSIHFECPDDMLSLHIPLRDRELFVRVYIFSNPPIIYLNTFDLALGKIEGHHGRI